jgi:antitoxin component YwqK of YwqJK toxin-antitoxin module
MKKLLITSLLLLVSISFVMAQNSFNQMGSNGLKQGAWEEKTSTGTTKGNYSNDQKDGCWTSYATDGKLTRIEHFKLGMRDGIAVDIDQRGYLVSESYYVNNLLEGTAKKFFYGTNLASSIDYLHGKINGKKKIYYENSAGKLTEESEYKDDMKNGVSNFYSINGDPVAEYNYVNNMLQGVQKTFYAGKKIMSEQEFSQNIENGFTKEYYENGKLKSEGTYVKGVLSGVWKSYNEEGLLMEEGSYVNGEKEGKWLEYDAAGKVTKTTKYMKGQVK